MAQEIVLPQWGMEMQDATVVKWLKQEGDPIQEGEPLVELETAKIATELESIASGVVAHILVPEGATVPIRTVLAIVAAPGEQVSRPLGAAPAVTAARASAPAALSRSAAQGLLRSCRQHAVWPRSRGSIWPRSRGQGQEAEFLSTMCTRRSRPAPLSRRHQPRSLSR